MNTQAVKATRMELRRLKAKLTTARRGHKLLKDKRDELVRQFLVLVRENYSLRKEVEAQIGKATAGFARARALMPGQVLETALLIGGGEVDIDVGMRNIMGVQTPVFRLRTESKPPAHQYPYGLAFTAEELDVAVADMSGLLPAMLALAEAEKTCRILSYEIERTRRRVNALEHVVIPETEQQLRYIKMKLDENERSAQVRIMKVKDMIYQNMYGRQA